MARLRIVIVGAGAAGLAAATKLLREAGNGTLQITILEASSYVGGRILPVHHWSGAGPVDMGAEFVHGDTSVVTELAKTEGWTMETVLKHDFALKANHAVHTGDGLVQVWDADYPPMAEAMAAMQRIQELAWQANRTVHRRMEANIGYDRSATSRPCSTSGADSESDGFGIECEGDGDRDGNEGTPDTSFATVFQQQGVSEEARAIVKCLYLQTEGGCWDDFGLADFGEDWPYGDSDMRFLDSYQVLLDHFKKSLGSTSDVDIHLSSPVTAVAAVEAAGGLNKGMEVHYHNCETRLNETMECDSVIMTAPVKVLQQNTIAFRPALPTSVRHAINSLPMHACIKIYMRFSGCFWPSHLTAWDCCTGHLSQFWVNSRTGLSTEDRSCGQFPYPGLLNKPAKGAVVEEVSRCDISALASAADQPVPIVAPSGVHMVCGFATADVAEAACHLSAVALVERTLAQLDDIFRNYASTDGTASSSFESALVCNWSKHPYVQGGYSGPAIGGVQSRMCLSEPQYDGRLHFAGEATHRQPSSVQAAVETGHRAASRVVQYCLHASQS